jgi:hypothetical protein
MEILPLVPQASVDLTTITPFDEVQKKKQGAGNELLPGLRDWLNILGTLKTTTNIPSRAPRTMSDSVVIYVNSVTSPSVKKLYVYSRECDVWFSVNLT